jgi:hypothetical protein
LKQIAWTPNAERLSAAMPFLRPFPRWRYRTKPLLVPSYRTLPTLPLRALGPKTLRGARSIVPDFNCFPDFSQSIPFSLALPLRHSQELGNWRPRRSEIGRARRKERTSSGFDTGLKICQTSQLNLARVACRECLIAVVRQFSKKT